MGTTRRPAGRRLAGQGDGQAGGGGPDPDGVEGCPVGKAQAAVGGHHLHVHAEAVQPLGGPIGQLGNPPRR